MSDVSPLGKTFEAQLVKELGQLNVTTLAGEGEKREQVVLWPAKERVALYKVVADYLGAKHDAAPKGEGYGGALVKGEDTA